MGAKMNVEQTTLVTPFDFTELQQVKFVMHDEGPDYAINFVPMTEKDFSFVAGKELET